MTVEPLRPGDPDRIGGYECVGRLGAGGMGQVFLARAGDGELVALKLIHADLARDPAFRARFAREAEAVRRVSGPYTAPLLDSGEDPRPWLVTAYLRGLSLDLAVRRYGPLNAEATRRLGAALARTLEAMHRAGVVHRDLKPANIMLTVDGPRVVDFGIAGGADAIPHDGEAPIGTPAYMAPELFTGEPVTQAIDLFALGGVLAFCRTGAAPFRYGPPAERLDPDGRSESVPDDGDAALSALINACLDEDPARRPSPEQLAAALSRSRDGISGTAWLPPTVGRDIVARTRSAPAVPVPRDARGPRRRRVLLRVAETGAAALAGVAMVRLVTDEPTPQAPLLWVARTTVVTPDEFGPVLGDGLLLLDRTVVTASGAARLDLCCLDTATGRYRWRRPIDPFDRQDGGLLASPEGIWIRTRRGLHEVDPAGGAVRWSRQRAFPGPAPSTARGGGLVFDISAAAGSGDNGTVHAHEAGTGRVVWERRIDGRPVSPVVEKGVVYVVSVSARDGWLRVHALDAAGGRARWISGSGDDQVTGTDGPASRDTDATLRVAGDTVYVSVEGRLLDALDVRTGAARWRTRPRPRTGEKPAEPVPGAAMPVVDGSTLFLGTGDGLLHAFDTRDGHRRWAVPTGAPPHAVGAFRRRPTPAVGHGLVFVRGAESIRALRADDGTVRWEHRTGPSAGEPLLAGGTLHIPGKREVTSHDPVSGRILQRLDLRPHTRYPAAVLAGREALYVLAGVDAVIAVGLPS
ncbi:hypothetical protein GCM10010191_05480 [Actinomadura vinacea]|uniref:Protein kinase domain-containing protein n=1 Tax=Actinomadura vinacea TaxID=115336 RepID=A0ABP5VER9_9ACTN